MATRTISDVVSRKTWVTGRKAIWGFRKGDHNNPSIQRRLLRPPKLIVRPLARVIYRTQAENNARDYLEFAYSVVPYGVVDRDDIASEIVWDILTGNTTRETVNWQNYRRKVYRENFEPRKASFRTAESEGFALDRFAFELAQHQNDR